MFLSRINTEDKLPSDTLKNIYKVSSKSKKKPSLTWVLLKVYFLELWKSWMCKFTHDLLMFVSPMILKYAIGSFSFDFIVFIAKILSLAFLFQPFDMIYVFTNICGECLRYSIPT